MMVAALSTNAFYKSVVQGFFATTVLLPSYGSQRDNVFFCGKCRALLFFPHNQCFMYAVYQYSRMNNTTNYI